MANIDTIRIGRAPVPGLAAPFARLFAMLRAWHDARVTRRALERLSPRELDDIGLCRADIERIASGRTDRA